MSFASFNLRPRILSTLQKLGYNVPTPIQNQSIPSILLGKDVMGLAQTGTGKTAAFAIPIIQRLMDEKATQSKKVRALVLSPTRELAQQTHEAILALSKETGLHSATLYGGVNIRAQVKNLQRGVEIVVACPGRLLDHLQQGTVDLKNVEMLVLDEADQMFDMGFLPDIRRILRILPKHKQTLLFSATMPRAIDELAQEVLHKPVIIKINHHVPVAAIKQSLYPVDPHLKTELLLEILNKIPYDSVLVFTRTKHNAQKLAKKLTSAGFSATSLQGNLSQNKRQKAMQSFRNKSVQILVATDIASRGIDVAGISHVINYDMPNTVEAYIHRIGRTGRSDNTGEALTLVTKEDNTNIRNLERVLGKKIKQCKLNEFNYHAPKTSSSPTHSERSHKTTHSETPNKKKKQKKFHRNWKN